MSQPDWILQNRGFAQELYFPSQRIQLAFLTITPLAIKCSAPLMIGHKQGTNYREPKHGGPDRLLMFLVLAFVGMVLLRAFWLFH
jgi:hypothetical protein